jgi:hypothetical protein
MRGGFLIAADRGLFERAASALVALGGAQAVDESGDVVVQLADTEGRLFTLYERPFERTEWEVREGTFTTAPGVQLPDMNTVTACPFDCRWPEVAARIAGVVARTAEAPTWLLDGDGVVWNAEAVDALKVRL